MSVRLLFHIYDKVFEFHLPCRKDPRRVMSRELMLAVASAPEKGVYFKAIYPLEKFGEYSPGWYRFWSCLLLSLYISSWRDWFTNFFSGRRDRPGKEGFSLSGSHVMISWTILCHNWTHSSYNNEVFGPFSPVCTAWNSPAAFGRIIWWASRSCRCFQDLLAEGCAHELL